MVNFVSLNSPLMSMLIQIFKSFDVSQTLAQQQLNVDQLRLTNIMGILDRFTS